MKWIDYKLLKIDKESKNYPKQLIDLSDSPKQLYYRGVLSKTLLSKSIAIVGSRRMTRYGASVVDQFVSHFVLSGVTTITGYMYGVDTEVHTKTVEYGGRTIAVMGGGINQPYPPENDKLYTKILQSGGIVLSEYDPEMKPKLWTYPERNRIIAALSSLGILVIEASEKSGSLITVKYAQKLNKKIYAVPGPITSSVSEGTNKLIKEGMAYLVTSPQDIVNDTKAKVDEEVKYSDPVESKIVGALKNEELSIDELSVQLALDVVSLSQTLTTLSLRGLVCETGGKYFLVK